MTIGWAEMAARQFEPPRAREPDPTLDGGPAVLAQHLDPIGYVRRPHLDVISQAWLDIHHGRINRVALSTPSQAGKTTTSVDWAVFWWLVLHPRDRVVVGSYGDSLAVVRGRAVRRLVEQHGARYGLDLDRSSHAAHDWALKTGGGLLSVGVGSGLTGRPADLVIIDDPHKDRVEADSPAVRRHVHDWWSSVVVPRVAPNGAILVVATRWHDDDLIGRVTAHEGTTDNGGRWKVIAMPALATSPTDPLGRALGDPLPHPRIPDGDTEALLRHWLERRASMTPRDWSAICQCDPKPPGGALVTADELRLVRVFDPGEHAAPVRVGVAVDPSGGGRDTAGIIAGYLGEDRRLWFTHDATMVGPADRWARAAVRLAADVDADLIVYEANYGGDMARVVIRTAWDALVREGVIGELRICPRLEPVHSRRGKLLRAEPVAQAWREGRIRTAAYLPEMESEWVSWSPTSGESPGRIDASTHLAWGLLPTPGGRSRVVAPAGQLPASTVSPLGLGGSGGGFGSSGLGPLA